MKMFKLTTIFLIFVVSAVTFVFSDSSQEWNAKVVNFKESLKDNPEAVDEWLQTWESSQNEIEIPEFTCEIQEPGEPPLSVHRLRPGDIKVIAAFGDSVTSGNGVGADTLPGVAIENRGQSWCIGVNGTIETDLTLPNLLKEFNPELVGGSWSRPGRDGDRNKTHCSEIMPECAQLNVAVPGATNRDMVEQAEDLIAKLIDHPDVDMENDWKLMTLLIGGNDLCACCRRWEVYNPEYYTASIKAAIETIKAQVPKVFFQVVAMLDVTPLANVSTGIVCDIAQRQFCDCSLHNETTKAIVRYAHMRYWELLDELININGTFDGDDSFTVVLQPHMRDMTIPLTSDGEWDTSYVAPDCFHPNLKAHQLFAYQLWNMMLTPVQGKPFVYPEENEKQFYCPTEETPFIFTNENSRDFMKKKVIPVFRDSSQEWNAKVVNFKESLKDYPEAVDEWLQTWESSQNEIEIPEFTCEIQEPGEPPLSVHRLRPGDIKVIAAFGDSVTSGNGVGADTLPGVAIENRGQSWCIGVNGTIETDLTLPNLLKEFNPELVGGSWSRPGRDGDRNKTHCSEIMPECAQLNVAVPGATNRDMVEQAEDLIAKLIDHPDVDMENDWKLMTLLIGGNDLCACCRRWEVYNPEYYTASIKAAIETIKAQVPKVFFQVVAMLDVTPLANVSTGIVCDIAQRQFCDCSLHNETTKAIVRYAHMRYWELLDELININGTFDGDDSFTVVLQTHMRDMTIPLTSDGEWDTSYVAPDCFHPNLKAHQLFAYQLWNMMLTPVQDKPFVYPDENEKQFYCPTEETPFIFTNDNSRNYMKKKVIPDFNNIKDWDAKLSTVIDWLEKDPEMKKKWTEHLHQMQDDEIEVPPFSCDVVESIIPPQSVHELRPSDIKVIGAMGDSVTAGYGVGANFLPQVPIQNRGESWSIGGNHTISEELTIANILKVFNPDLNGWSYMIDMRESCYRHDDCAQLNVAMGGATSPNMPGQAIDIIERVKENPEINMDKDWKLITLFIGGNDLCSGCWDENKFGPKSYVANIKTALDSLESEMPLTLVQVVAMFDVAPITNMSTGFVCDVIHSLFCSCGYYEKPKEDRKATQMEYWRLLDELININGTYDNNDKFTVVLQPHLRDLTPPKTDEGDWDKSFFSPDCFHPNKKGHQHLAYQLWNVMLTPLQEKPFFYPLEDPEDMVFKCPTEEKPFIFTNRNSQTLNRKHSKWEQGLNEDQQIYETKLNSIKEALNDLPIDLESEQEDHANNDLDDDDDDLYIPPFLCDVSDLPQIPANNVHELKPSDIKVVAALGDSITAGNGLGANTKPGVLVENRGESWSIGGNQTIETMLTVPNLIKEYNPNVVGWSWSRYSRLDRNETHCDERMDCAQFNVAKPGGTNRGMAGQATTLIDRMKDENLTNGEVDFENDWKLITIFVGGNDLCRVCENNNSYSADAYRDGLRDALDILHENVPRALVNLVIMFDVTPLTNMSTGIACDLLHIGFCMCAVNKTTRGDLRDIQLDYYRKLNELVESGRYNTSDDFTVVIQPHQRDIKPVLDSDGNIDHSYFSPDCFHPSRKGHHGFAYMLWNVMLIPVGKKPFEYDSYEEPVFYCPCRAHPYIFTNFNSDVEWNACDKNPIATSKNLLSKQKQNAQDIDDELLAPELQEAEDAVNNHGYIFAACALVFLVSGIIATAVVIFNSKKVDRHNMNKHNNTDHQALHRGSEAIHTNLAFDLEA